MTNIHHADAAAVRNIRKARAILHDWGWDQEKALRYLVASNLITTPPRIIRTCDELAALDPDTVLIDADSPWCEVRTSAREWMEDYDIDVEGIYPLAVIATGDQVRAARQALEDTDATD